MENAGLTLLKQALNPCIMMRNAVMAKVTKADFMAFTDAIFPVGGGGTSNRTG